MPDQPHQHVRESVASGAATSGNPDSFQIVPPTTDALWEEYLQCRYRGLYEPFGLPLTCTTSELDFPRERPEILHRCALSSAGQVVAVGRLDLQPAHPSRGSTAQLRYFAVDAAARGRGAGQALLRALEQEAVNRSIPTLWMEARVAALNFYIRMGYSDEGVGPLKWGQIPHRILSRSLATGSFSAERP